MKNFSPHGILSLSTGAVYDLPQSYLREEAQDCESMAALLIHHHNVANDDLAVIRALAEGLRKRNIGVIPVFTDTEAIGFRELVSRYLTVDGVLVVDALVNFILFLIKPQGNRSIAVQSVLEFERLGLPVIFPVVSFYISKDQWQESNLPISADMPNALIAPEMAGMTETVFIGARNLETDKSEPLKEQVDFIAGKIKKRLGLRKKEKREKKLAIILHNSVCSGVEATIGKSFGLDAFESVVRILKRLEAEGYYVGNPPQDGDGLRRLVMEKKAFSDFRWTGAEDIVQSGGCLYRMPPAVYGGFYGELDSSLQNAMEETWGAPPGEGMVCGGDIIVSGLEFGNTALMVQPKRGCYGAKCTGEVCKILHDPACPPPHQYLATYRFIERVFRADAILEVGTDGSLEYLPGKINGLSTRCWPLVVSGEIPVVYVYNAGVTNEALIVKRRINATLIDHLPPSSAGITDEKTRRLDRSITDYFRALELGNDQDKAIKEEIIALVQESPAARRIIQNAKDTDTALHKIQDAVKTADAARKISRNHIFGDAPCEEETENYIHEVLLGEGALSGTQDGKTDELRDNLKKCGQEMDMLVRALNGGYVPAGESGIPDENGRKILPTGRNMFGMNVEKIPTRIAYRRGKEIAEQVLDA